MPATTPHRRVLVTLPPPLDERVAAAAETAGLSVPAYLTALAAKALKVQLDAPLRPGRPGEKKTSAKSGK